VVFGARAALTRVALVHQKPEEASDALERLRAGAFDAACVTVKSAADFRRLRESPPSVLVVDLSRAPSHGRAVAGEWRRNRTTRYVPLVFLGGDAEKVAMVRQSFPDAVYASAATLVESVRHAMRNAPEDPVVIPPMSEYTHSPLPKKLGIGPGTAYHVINEPQGFRRKLGAEPGAAPAHRVLFFVRSAAELKKGLRAAIGAVAAGGGLWIVYPKKASGVETDLTQQSVRETGMAAGWVDYKVCAVDETWTGLCFARRKANIPPVRSALPSK
jgi:hypothetical protein